MGWVSGLSGGTDLPPISVIIPTYNRADLVLRAVSSVLGQCRDDDEIIVVDDGSTDGTEEVLSPFLERIIYKRLPNGGVSRARNGGLRLAQNPLVAFLDSDDEWLPHKIDLQRRLMAALPDVLFCFSDVTIQLGSGERIERARSHAWDTTELGALILGRGRRYSGLAPLPDDCPDFDVHLGNIYDASSGGPVVTCSTAMVRRNEGGRRVFFPEDISYSEDWEYFSRLSREGVAAFMATDSAMVHVDYGESQLVHRHDTYKLETVISVSQRVWGADPEYLSREADRFQRMMDTRRFGLARELLRSGARKEARAHLKLMAERRPAYYLVTLIPASLLGVALTVRRSVVSLLPRWIRPNREATDPFHIKVERGGSRANSVGGDSG